MHNVLPSIVARVGKVSIGPNNVQSQKWSPLKNYFISKEVLKTEFIVSTKLFIDLSNCTQLAKDQYFLDHFNFLVPRKAFC